jgi:hypothetical protein
MRRYQRLAIRLNSQERAARSIPLSMEGEAAVAATHQRNNEAWGRPERVYGCPTCKKVRTRAVLEDK